MASTASADQEREQKRIHCETAKYLYEKWRENRKLYEEQIRTGVDHGIYYSVTKKPHPKFKHFTPLNLERYVRDWEIEHGIERTSSSEELETIESSTDRSRQKSQPKSNKNSPPSSSQSRHGKGSHSRKGQSSKSSVNDYDDFEEFGNGIES